MMKHYLVTGGAGFIGSHLVDWLLQSGDRVTVLDDFSTGRRENLSAQARLEVMTADVMEVEARDFSGPFDGLVHLAALPSVNDSWTELRRAHDLNLTATLRVLELARALKIPRLVYASSAAVYGNPARIPVQESDATLPLSPYGLQKLAGEHYGRLLAAEGVLTFVALRFFNVFGPRQVASSPYSGVISNFADALRCDKRITINGDGTQTRDFIYVTDVARGINRALLAANLAPFVVCNLGTGRAVSIRELAEMMRKNYPTWNGSIEMAPVPPGDIGQSQASTTAAKRVLDFQPEQSLEGGLAAMATAES
ncbi:MAG: NAD-dependent epimerase/dehydratase family protein [Chthoniobacterales bacterium]